MDNHRSPQESGPYRSEVSAVVKWYNPRRPDRKPLAAVWEVRDEDFSPRRMRHFGAKRHHCRTVGRAANQPLAGAGWVGLPVERAVRQEQSFRGPTIRGPTIRGPTLRQNSWAANHAPGMVLGVDRPLTLQAGQQAS